MDNAALIGVDWGTTHLRAALLDASGAVLVRQESKEGLMAVAAGGFEAALARATSELGGEGLPVLMSGMVGSASGWREAPYIDPPADAAALAAGIVPVGERADIGIVPGVCIGRTAPPGDVMRGEETEIVGALHALGLTGATFVLPGTHTKWATVEDGAITGFRSYMTGDLFNALCQQTVLSKTVTDAPDNPAAFERGVAMAERLESPGDLTTALFRLRPEHLMGRLPVEETADTLSGLLIGVEAISGLAAANGPVIVVGGAVLGPRYQRAIALLGGEATLAPRDCAMIGLAKLAAAR